MIFFTWVKHFIFKMLDISLELHSKTCDRGLCSIYITKLPNRIVYQVNGNKWISHQNWLSWVFKQNQRRTQSGSWWCETRELFWALQIYSTDQLQKLLKCWILIFLEREGFWLICGLDSYLLKDSFFDVLFWKRRRAVHIFWRAVAILAPNMFLMFLMRGGRKSPYPTETQSNVQLTCNYRTC